MEKLTGHGRDWQRRSTKRASITIVAVFPSSSVLVKGDRRPPKWDQSKRAGRGWIGSAMGEAVVIGGLLDGTLMVKEAAQDVVQ